MSHMSEAARIVDILGIKRKGAITSMTLVDAVEQGLPFRALSHVFDQVAPDEPGLRYQVVPRATFARKEAQGARLTREQSDQVTRLARVWDLALEVWKDPQGARAFLLKPHPLLEGRKPIQVALTAEGARLVEGILGRLLYGSAV